ncbi:MAG: hypothetical protein LBG17_03225 [Bacteroidales bacterium]|jgi:hypothetical protein|nr:hypothetical protein [Bacteroidales bacterium]
MKNNMSWIVGLLIGLAVGAAGGTTGGYFWGKKAINKQVVNKLDEANIKLGSTLFKLDTANLKLDSLQCLPPKIDTVIQYQLKVIERIDTVVVTTAEILQLSKAIKADTDTIKNIINEHKHSNF